MKKKVVAYHLNKAIARKALSTATVTTVEHIGIEAIILEIAGIEAQAIYMLVAFVIGAINAFRKYGDLLIEEEVE